MTEAGYDSNTWVEESGASTGDHRENDPTAPGFAPEHDRVFRSHFQHVNRLADREVEQDRPAYDLGFQAAQQLTSIRAFDAIEKDLENDWLNVRSRGGDWQSVRVFARAGFDVARQGSVEPFPETG